MEQNTTNFNKHRGPVTGAAGIPGTSKVVTSAYDSAVGLFDLETKEVQLLGYLDHLANGVTVNEAGTFAASVSSDYNIYIWNLKTNKLETILRGHSDDVEGFVFIDDHTAASVSRDWRILVWDLDTSSITKSIYGHEMDVLSVAYLEGKLITSGDDMTLRVWDLETGEQLRKWGPFETETDTCCVDALNKRAILGCDDGCIRIFDIESGAELKTINAHKSAIKKVAVSSKTGDILSAAYDQQIIIWDAHTFELKVQLEEQRSKWERSFSWTPDGTGILAGTFDGTVLHWDAKDGKLLNEVGEKGGNDCLNDVSADSNGAIATVNDAGFIRLGEVQTDASRWYSKTAPAAGRMLMNAVTMDAQLNVVVAGAHNMQLHIYDKVGHELMNEITVDLNEGPVNCIRISHIPGHEAIFVACYSGAIVKLSREGEILTKFHVHENAVKALRIHPTEAIGVSCSADGVLVSWDLDGNLLREYKGHMAIIDDVDLDPTGAYIASTGRDFTMKVFNLKSGEMVHSVSLGRRSPKGICFYDADTVIVTNYWGELIRITLSTEESLTKQIARNGISAIDRCGENVVAVSYCGAAILVNPADLTTINTLRAMTQRVDETEYV